MRQLVIAIVAAAAAGMLGACQTQQVDAAPPTVTFNTADRDLDEVALRADDYCEDHYGRDAHLVDRDRENGGYEVTFSCE